MELLKKLRINADKPLWIINAPGHILTYFQKLDVKQKLGKEKTIGQVMLFVYDSKEMADHVARLASYISHDTLFWICYPKKSGSITSNLTQIHGWDVVFDLGFRGQTSAYVDNDWSGFRVTNAPRKKLSDCDLPMAERNAEGIDFVNRTVKLPADAETVLKKYKGLSDFFYTQSFTCQREHVSAITDAKKEDTRRRRIEKMIEMLQQKMHAKELKKKR